MVNIETIQKSTQQIMIEEIKDKSELFQGFGISRTESSILASIIINGKMTAREIERLTDLRQPEVSNACKMLQERGWIQEGNKIACTGKGRPQQTYELAYKTIVPILEDIKKEQEKKITESKEKLEQLSKMK